MKHYIYFVLFLFIGLSCRTTKSKLDTDKILWAADWSPDGKLIAVGGSIGQLNFLSADGLKTQKSFKKRNTITKIKWHPDGKLIAISRQGVDKQDPEDNKAEIINIEDGTTITCDVIHARGLGWSNNGRMLAIGDGEGDLRIYSKSGHLIKKIQTEQKAIIGLSWHPSSGKIVTVGSHIEIIEVGNEKRTKIIPREIEILMLSVEWHPSGEFFVTGDYGDNVLDYPPLLIFWDAEGNKIKEVDASKAEYRNLKWSKNGQRLATASDKVRIWTKEGNLIKERNLGSLLWGIDWNRKNDKIVVTSIDGKVFVLDEHLTQFKEGKITFLNNSETSVESKTSAPEKPSDLSEKDDNINTNNEQPVSSSNKPTNFYLDTKNLLKGEKELDPVLTELKSRITSEFNNNRIANLFYEIVDKRGSKGKTRPKLTIVLEKDLSIKEKVGKISNEKKKRISNTFKKILEKESNTKYKSDDLFIIFKAFNPKARKEAHDKVSQQFLENLKSKYADSKIWEISRFGESVTIFFYTTAEVDTKCQTKMITDLRNEYFQKLKSHDEFNLIEIDKINFKCDSKENFDENYQSNWYYYYR